MTRVPSPQVPWIIAYPRHLLRRFGTETGRRRRPASLTEQTCVRAGSAICRLRQERSLPGVAGVVGDYRVVPDREALKHGQIRVIDESGEDYLYPKEYFEFVSLPPKLRRVHRSRAVA